MAVRSRFTSRQLAGGLTGFALNSFTVHAPPFTVMFGSVAVVRGVADRTVNELSDEIRVSGVAESLCDDVNEDVVEVDRLITPPRHGTRRVKVQRLDRCIRGLTRLAIIANDVLPCFVGSYEKVGVVFDSLLEPEIWLSHRSAKDWSEVAEFDERQVLDDTEEAGSTANERAPDVVLRKVVQFPHDDVTRGLQVAMQYILHGVTQYTKSEKDFERKLRNLAFRRLDENVLVPSTGD